MQAPHFLQTIDDNENEKGWSYSNVYYFKELRDIAWVIHQNPNLSRDKLILLIENTVSYQGATWSKRRVYECINALINFKIFDKSLKPLKNWFINVNIDEPLSEADLLIFETIYFSYDKFINYHSLFINNQDFNIEDIKRSAQWIRQQVKENSTSVIASSTKGKYINRFSYSDNNIIYTIPHKYVTLMVFWDVYIKWGKTLKLIEKISFNELPASVSEKIINNHNQKELRNASVTYFITDTVIDIQKFISNNIKNKYIYIPELITMACIKHRISIEKSKQIVTNFIHENRGKITVERTSSVFIKEAEKQFYPIINDSFVSHLLF